jgi:putative FmdB family regulatory protein
VPTYDYQCRNCGNTTEVIHSMLEDGPTTCEACGGPLRRVLYPAGIIFKGSGFYKTDSRNSTSSSVGSSPAKESATSAPATDGAGRGSGSASSSSKSEAGSTAPAKAADSPSA